MIDLFAIDRWGGTGSSWLHRASTPAKLLSVFILISILVVSRDAAALAVVGVGVLAALVSARLPLVPVLGLALGPILMSSLFAITRLGGSWESALVIVEKGAITCLTMLILVSTTPRTDLFRALRRIFPARLADIVLLAYRSVFVLLERALETRQALRLRGNPVRWPKQIQRSALVVGLAFLRANELASEQYAAMQLRGYPGYSSTSLEWRRHADLFLLSAVALTAVAALALAPRLALPLLSGV